MAQETLQQRLMRHEGFCAFPKPDAKGAWVVGFGHDITPQQTKQYAGGISKDDALKLLNADIAIARNAVTLNFPWITQISQTRQDIVTEMCFQLGIGGVLGFHDFLFCLRSGDYVGAARNMLEGNTPTGMSEWYNKTPDRCAELAETMEEGE